MRVENRPILRVALFGIILITSAFNSAFASDSLNLRIISYDVNVTSGRTTGVEVKFIFNGHATFYDVGVQAETADNIHFQLLTTAIDRIRPNDQVILKAEISPSWSIYRRREPVTFKFNSGGHITERNVPISIEPTPWFWPLTGGIFGLIIALVFIIVFRRLSQGDSYG